MSMYRGLEQEIVTAKRSDIPRSHPPSPPPSIGGVSMGLWQFIRVFADWSAQLGVFWLTIQRDEITFEKTTEGGGCLILLAD